jgi:SAM-dependent methyltransferase
MSQSRAIFDLPKEKLEELSLPRLRFRYAWEFALDGDTPGRTINDAGVRALMPFLEGPGAIVELGGVGNHYKNFARAEQAYEVTNLDGSCDRIIDMTNMAYANDSVDAIMSMFALEHIYDFQAVIRECHRCLKPKGRLLLAVPFLYCYHAAPDDYFRFTHSALDKMLTNFTVLKSFSFGNRQLTISQYYHEKGALGSNKRWPMRTFLRFLVLPMLVGGMLGNQHDPVFAITHLYLVEKPADT